MTAYGQPVGQFSRMALAAALQHPPYQPQIQPSVATYDDGRRNRKKGTCAKRWTAEEETQLIETLAVPTHWRAADVLLTLFPLIHRVDVSPLEHAAALGGGAGVFSSSECGGIAAVRLLS